MAERDIGTGRNVGARKWVANFFVQSPGPRCMMQITNNAWKDTISQIVEEDSAAC
jgi:hypothetical protein